MPTLHVSVVVYHLDEDVLERLLASLDLAISAATELITWHRITLIDNGNNRQTLERILQSYPQVELRGGHGNIGYGRGHNLAILDISADSGADPVSDGPDWHLVLNPDVYLQRDTLSQGLQWLADHPDAVAVAPTIRAEDGSAEYACKRYPSVLDLFLRGFMPAFIRRRFARRLARYEMRDLSTSEATRGVPIISGCFMLFRGPALRELGGFDPRYFLYFEDFDLSLRAGRLGSIDHLPAMRITHLGGGASRKGLRHILLFSRSALRFFRSHGWRWF